jgi:hypothetical protein
LENQRSFLVKLPGSNKLYYPCYKKKVYIEGDIVFFSPAQTRMFSVYLGQIKGVGYIGSQSKVQRHYDVDCIRRPAGRDKGSWVNELSKIKIFDTTVVAQLLPHPDY